MTGFMVIILLILAALLMAVVSMVYFIASSGNRKTLCLRLAVLLCGRTGPSRMGGLRALSCSRRPLHHCVGIQL